MAESPEAIALELLFRVAQAEGKTSGNVFSPGFGADKKWLLDTYAECLIAISAPYKRLE